MIGLNKNLSLDLSWIKALSNPLLKNSYTSSEFIIHILLIAYKAATVILGSPLYNSVTSCNMMGVEHTIWGS